MKNFEYWKICLNEVLESVTDEQVEKIMLISEMEYEATGQSEAHKESTINPLSNEVEKLNKEIGVLKAVLCKQMKVDSVDVVGNGVEWFKR
jgi:hypothetical protein